MLVSFFFNYSYCCKTNSKCAHITGKRRRGGSYQYRISVLVSLLYKKYIYLCVYMQSILLILQMLLRPLGKQAYGTDVCAHRNARHNWSSSANTTRRCATQRYKMAVSSATHLPSGPQIKIRKQTSRKALEAKTKRSCRYDGAVTSITLFQRRHITLTFPANVLHSTAIVCHSMWQQHLSQRLVTGLYENMRSPTPCCSLEWHCKPSMWLPGCFNDTTQGFVLCLP